MYQSETHSLGQHKPGAIPTILLVCVLAAAMILIALTVFKVPLGSILMGALFLACPLMHIVMMKIGNHKH